MSTSEDTLRDGDAPRPAEAGAPEAVAPEQVKDKTIGQVLSHLDADFPGLSASKVRFLEDRGLLFPQRTDTGYRKYSAQDIARLRYVLTLQRDQYLPLKVIKEALDELDRTGAPLPEAAAAPAPAAGEVPAAREAVLPASATPRTYSIRELAHHTSAQLPLLRELVDYGLIAPDAQGNFDQHAARTTRLCLRLTAHGIQPRHLRSFRAAADREIGLVQQTVAPLASRRDEDSRRRAGETAREIAQLCAGLHESLVAEQTERNWPEEA